MVIRALSQLPVSKGQEAEVLNREVFPMLREILVALQNAGGSVTDLTAVEEKLDTVIELLAPETAETTQVASTTSSAVFASQDCALGFWAKSISTSTQKTYIFKGSPATTGNGYELIAGEERFFPCRNMDEYSHISSAISANLCIEAI